MDGRGPNSRNWEATELTDFGGGNRKIRVTGEVEVGSLGHHPQLRVADTTPINERVLMLELTIRQGGGGAVMNYKPVEYEDSSVEDQYSDVVILWESASIATVGVEKTIS